MSSSAMDRIRSLGGSRASTSASEPTGPKGGDLTRNSKLVQGASESQRSEEGHAVEGVDGKPYQQVREDSTEELDEESSIDLKK